MGLLFDIWLITNIVGTLLWILFIALCILGVILDKLLK